MKAAGRLLLFCCFAGQVSGTVLSSDLLQNYVDRFNAEDDEIYTNVVSNAQACEFLKKNIPLFECPDTDFERTWYFRWWTYRKHLKETPDGYVVTEFLPDVPWSGKYNTISCPAALHFYEGRWLRNPQYLNDYAVFWFRRGGEPRRYSCWLADALHARHLVQPNQNLLTDLLDDLVTNYRRWEKEKRDESRLFYQIDDRDGMEVSIGGSGYRATLNSYMYGDARAIAAVASLAGRDDIAGDFTKEADELRELILSRLWDEGFSFFKVLPPGSSDRLVDVRELHGYTPWYFNLPPNGKGYETAWKQLMDPEGFYAPFGPTTAEQRHPGFTISYEGHECQWNGPSWPLSTSITLTALANVLNNYTQDVISKRDYFETLRIYTRSQQLKRADGGMIPWIDEDLNPFTGDWIARTRLTEFGDSPKVKGKGGKDRGKDYNHSTYNDLIITGLAGLRPRADNIVEVNPLLPADTWDYFCLDNVFYHGHTLTILWDKTGEKYGKGSGLKVYVDGQCIGESPVLSKVTGLLE
jgi:hypothetical protein